MTTTDLAREGRAQGHTGADLVAYIQREAVLLIGRPVSAYEVREAVRESDTGKERGDG